MMPSITVLMLGTAISLAQDAASFSAVAGEPVMAYPGDVVVLTAAGSTGPGQRPLALEWTQTRGPDVRLTDPTAGRPTFTAEQPGLHQFELRVGRDGVWSEPATTDVVVVDPDAARRSYSCQVAPTALAWWLPLLCVGYRRR